MVWQIGRRALFHRSPRRSAMQPERISLGPVQPSPYDLLPLARQRLQVLAIDQLHQWPVATCSRIVMRWALAGWPAKPNNIKTSPNSARVFIVVLLRMVKSLARDGLRRHLVRCRFLVALPLSGGLFIYAKDLFVAASLR